MSRARTKLLSGAIALFVGAVMLPVLLLAILGGLARAGIKLEGLPLAYATVVSGLAAYEAFRSTFNGLCERWSNEPVPPRIHGWRYQRNVVRSS